MTVDQDTDKAIKNGRRDGDHTAATTNVVPEIRQEGRCWLLVSSIDELYIYFIQQST